MFWSTNSHCKSIQREASLALRNSQLWKWLSAGWEQIQSECGQDPGFAFIRHFHLLFPHANCCTRSSTDRFGLGNINSEIKETNRRQQCWGNKHNMQVVNCVCVRRIEVGQCFSLTMCWCAYVSISSRTHSHSCGGIYACMCAVQTEFPAVVPAGVCCCCISVCTADSDFHSQRSADGVYMCQPLQKITNPPQQKQNVPLSFCNSQWERSRKTRGGILKAAMTDLWNHRPRDSRDGAKARL